MIHPPLKIVTYKTIHLRLLMYQLTTIADFWSFFFLDSKWKMCWNSLCNTEIGGLSVSDWLLPDTSEHTATLQTSLQTYQQTRAEQIPACWGMLIKPTHTLSLFLLPTYLHTHTLPFTSTYCEWPATWIICHFKLSYITHQWLKPL